LQEAPGLGVVSAGPVVVEAGFGVEFAPGEEIGGVDGLAAGLDPAVGT
jgi:hypothetical protein